MTTYGSKLALLISGCVKTFANGRMLEGLCDRTKTGMCHDRAKLPHAVHRRSAKIGSRSLPAKVGLREHTDPYLLGYDRNNADFHLFKKWRASLINIRAGQATESVVRALAA